MGSLKRGELFPLVAMLFVTTVLLSNIVSQKTFAAGPFVFPAATIFFPVSYILGDVLTEVYGYARARLVICGGLVCNLLMVAAFSLAIALPPGGEWGNQREYALVLGSVPRVVLASMAGYWAGEMANSYVLARMKLLTRGKFLWARTISSTIVGEGIDTALFVTIAFIGVLPGGFLARVAVSTCLCKIAYEAAATPLTYCAVKYLKRRDGIDIFREQKVEQLEFEP